jgi:hypothetical protein
MQALLENTFRLLNNIAYKEERNVANITAH